MWTLFLFYDLQLLTVIIHRGVMEIFNISIGDIDVGVSFKAWLVILIHCKWLRTLWKFLYSLPLRLLCHSHIRIHYLIRVLFEHIQDMQVIIITH